MGVCFFPAQIVLLQRLDHAVAQPFGVIAGQQELNRCVERANKFFFLAVEVLPNALGHRHCRSLQLQHAQGDAIDVEHEVGPSGVFPGNANLLGDGKVVVARVRPVDQIDGLGLLPDVWTHLDAVAEEAIHLAVGVVERFVAAERGGLVQCVECLVSDFGAMPLPRQPVAERFLLDIGVVAPPLPVAEVRIAERVSKKRDHALLCKNLFLTDCTHVFDLLSARSEIATAARPSSVRRYFCKGLLGLSGMVLSSNPSFRRRASRFLKSPVRRE